MTHVWHVCRKCLPQNIDSYTEPFRTFCFTTYKVKDFCSIKNWKIVKEISFVISLKHTFPISRSFEIPVYRLLEMCSCQRGSSGDNSFICQTTGVSGRAPMLGLFSAQDWARDLAHSSQELYQLSHILRHKRQFSTSWFGIFFQAFIAVVPNLPYAATL